MTARDKRLEKAQMRVLFSVPFFAPGVAKLPVVWDSKVETACTNGTDIHWNPEWFDKLSDAVIPTVLCHEVCHCMLGHLWRAPAGVDWEEWNKATDHAVNLMLMEFSDMVKGKNLAEPFPFPEPKDAFCANPAFKGMSEEHIYQILAGNKPKGGQGGGPGKSGQGQGQGQPGPGSMPSFGQMTQPAPGQQASAQAKQTQTDWSNTLMQAAAMAKGRGELPGDMASLVEELINPKVPWQDLLRSFLREQCSDDWNWLEPAMEYEGSGFIMPSLKSDKVGRVVFATDTSGSTSPFWAQFQCEKQNCLDEIRPSHLTDIYCDSRVQEVREYSPGDQVNLNVPGGGGTSFVPVFELAETMDPPPKALVYLTDLDGAFPDKEPPFPVIWVCTGEGKAPFGETIHAEPPR